ncbi:hypothetical protein JCM16303_003802 [Sporobolomyces ruberrimus]
MTTPARMPVHALQPVCTTVNRFKLYLQVLGGHSRPFAITIPRRGSFTFAKWRAGLEEELIEGVKRVKPDLVSACRHEEKRDIELDPVAIVWYWIGKLLKEVVESVVATAPTPEEPDEIRTPADLFLHVSEMSLPLCERIRAAASNGKDSIDPVGFLISSVGEDVISHAAEHYFLQPAVLEPYLRCMVTRELIPGNRLKNLKDKLIPSWAIYLADFADWFSSRHPQMRDRTFLTSLKRACKAEVAGKKPVKAATLNLRTFLPEPSKIWDRLNATRRKGESSSGPSDTLPEETGSSSVPRSSRASNIYALLNATEPEKSGSPSNSLSHYSRHLLNTRQQMIYGSREL